MEVEGKMYSTKYQEILEANAKVSPDIEVEERFGIPAKKISKAYSTSKSTMKYLQER